jgi:hypothetical protein
LLIGRPAVLSQAPPIASLWSLSRLCVAAISRHSERRTDLPRRRKVVDPPIEFRLREDRFDDRLAFAVELARARSQARGATTRRRRRPIPAERFALAGVGRDQHLDAAIHALCHLLLMPVAASATTTSGVTVRPAASRLHNHRLAAAGG